MRLLVLIMGQRSAPGAGRIDNDDLPECVREAIEDGTPTQKRRARSFVHGVRSAQNRAREIGTELEHSFRASRDEHGSVSLSVKPETSMFVKGEIGSDRAHVILGERGGVRLAEVSRLGDRSSYDDKTSAFRKFYRALTRLG